MTAKTTASDTNRKDWKIQSLPMIAAETIYKGSTVLLNGTSKNAFTNDWTTNTIAAWDVFAWIAEETADNSTWAAWDVEVRVMRDWLHLLTFSDTLTKANEWATVYVNNVTDDSVVSITVDGSGVDVAIWTIIQFVSSSTAYVDIAWKAWVSIAA